MEVTVASIKCKTVFLEKAIEIDLANQLYLLLKHNIEWQEGIRSKQGFTRKAKALNIGDITEIDDAIVTVLNKITTTNYMINGIYLNYYENENMWTPNHSHKGTHQLVISLGETRTLQVGNKNYDMIGGSAIIFGGSIHGVPKENTPKNGRISVATFMTPVNIK